MEKEIKMLYRPMSWVCREFNASNNTIRNWCDWFAIEPRRDRKGNRRFNEKDIMRLRVVYILLRVEQYTVRGVQTYLGLHYETKAKTPVR